MNIRNLHRDGQWHTPFLPCWKPEDGPHPRKRPRALCFEALLALMMLLMVACTAVQDPSERWKSSGMDVGLEGKWEDKKEGQFTFGGSDDDAPPPRKPPQYVFAKQKDGYYLWRDVNDAKDKPMAIRTFMAGKRNFMLMVKPAAIEKGFDKVQGEDGLGGVSIYEIKDDILTVYMLNHKRLDQAIQEGKVKGKDSNLATLDDATCAVLAEFSMDEQLPKEESAWVKIAQFKRVKDEAPAKKTDEKPAEKPATK